MLFRWRKARQATALLLVLFVTSLAVMFIGALLVSNRSSLRLAAGMAEDKSAVANAQSGLDYCWQQLEANRMLGCHPFVDKSPVGYIGATDRLRTFYANPQGDLNRQTIEGVFSDHPESGFQIRLWNRLEADTPGAVDLGRTAPFGVLNQVDKGSVLVQVVGYCGKRERKIEAFLRKSPFVSHALLAGGSTTCTVPQDGDWKLHSFDPLRNSFYTKGDLRVQGLRQGKLQFLPTTGSSQEQGRYGAAMANKIYDTGQTALSDADLAQAGGTSKGLLVGGSGQNPNVKDLKPDDMKLPEKKVALKGGVYRFGATQMRVDETWEQWHDGDPGHWSRESGYQMVSVPTFGRYASQDSQQAQQLWTADATLPPPRTGPGIRNAEVIPNAAVKGHRQNNGTIQVKNERGEVAAEVDLVARTFEVPAGTLVDVDGNFVLDHRNLADSDRRPRVLLGKENPPSEDRTKVAAGIRTSGDLILEGGLRGSGTMVAGGKMSMYAESSLETSAARPVALYAEGDISLKKDNAPPPDSKTADTLDIEWKVFKQALQDDANLDNFLNESPGTQAGLVDQMLNNQVKLQNTDLRLDDFRSSVIQSFLSSSTTSMRTQASEAFSSMTADGSLSLNEAVRFREYCRQLVLDSEALIVNPQTGASEAAPPLAPRWLNLQQVRGEVGRLVQNQLDSYGALVGYQNLDGKEHFSSLKSWLSELQSNPYSRNDAFFRGLIYSHGGNFSVDAQFNRFTFQGSLVVPRGNINMSGARQGITNRYDPRYLRELLQASPLTVPLKLDQISWRLL